MKMNVVWFNVAQRDELCWVLGVKWCLWVWVCDFVHEMGGILGVCALCGWL